MFSSHHEEVCTYYVTEPGQAPCLLNEAQVAPLKMLWQDWFPTIATALTFRGNEDAQVYLDCAQEKSALEQQITVLQAYRYGHLLTLTEQADVLQEIAFLQQQMEVLTAFRRACLLLPSR